MRLLQRMGANRRTGPRLRPSRAASVIEVPVGQQNRPHVARREAELLDTAPNPPRVTRKPRVEQHRTFGIHQEAAPTHHVTDRMQPRRPVRIVICG